MTFGSCAYCPVIWNCCRDLMSGINPHPWVVSMKRASRWSVALRTFYRQILSLTYRCFFLETSAPGLPGSTCKSMCLISYKLYSLCIAHCVFPCSTLSININMYSREREREERIQKCRWKTFEYLHKNIQTQEHCSRKSDCMVSLGSCIGSCGQGLVCQLVQIRTGKMPQVDQSLNDIH